MSDEISSFSFETRGAKDVVDLGISSCVLLAKERFRIELFEFIAKFITRCHKI